MIAICEDDLSGAAVHALLERHLAGMRAHSPEGSVHALDLDRLRAPGTTVWTAWIDGDLAGIAALRRLPDGGGEVKSMRTHDHHLRRGVAGALLDRLIAVARAEGLTRLSLETGSGGPFAPALELYLRRGFVVGAPFGGYSSTAFNRFLHLAL